MDSNITAVLLAGGKGERLRPFDGPKCLLPVCGKPLMEYTLEHISKFVNRINIAVGYKSDLVGRYLVGKIIDDRLFGLWNWGISDEGENASMIHRLKAASHPGLNLVCYADEYAPVDIPQLLTFHKSKRLPITVSTVSLKLDVGVFHAGSFVEKPLLRQYKVNIGYMLMDQEVIDQIGNYDSLAPVLFEYYDKEEIALYKHLGDRWTINTLRDLEEVERAMSDHRS